MRKKLRLTSAFQRLLLFCISLSIAGCASLFSSATNKLATNLASTIQNHNDLETVAAGAPAYMLMIDSFIEDNPDNLDMLNAGASLYSSYASVFVKDEKRSQRLADRALNYAFRAACLQRADACDLRKMTYQHFSQLINSLSQDDIKVFYTLGTSWAGWIQLNSEDWNAIAELPRVKAIMQQIIKQDEQYLSGEAHLYLGVLSTLLPPILGGKPEQGREHFQRAIKLSKEKNLMAKVVYAQKYARLIFDRKLHDRLLREVLKADPEVPGFTLKNNLAQRQARELLKSANDYF